MKKSTKVGLMAGLLITPAVIAQAGEAQASENVAAVSQLEILLSKFSQINENSSADLVSQSRTTYENLSPEDETILGSDLLSLIDAKLKYLEKYQDLKKQATTLKTSIDNFSNTNPKFIETADGLQTDLTKIKSDFTTVRDEIEAAAKKVDAQYATTLVDSLQYYNESSALKTDAELFLEAIVTPSKLSALQEKVTNKDAIEGFITGKLTTLVDLTTDGNFTKEQLTTAISEVNTALNSYTTTQKTIINAQYVPNVTPQTTVSNYITQASNTVKNVDAIETAMTKLLQTNFSSTSTFKNSVTSIETSYNKLADYQKALISDYETKIVNINAALKLAEGIEALANKTEITDELKSNIEELNNKYTELKGKSTIYSDLVFNYNSFEKANTLQNDITTAKSANDVTAIAKIISTYKTFSTSEKKYVTTANQSLLKTWESAISSASSVDKQISDINTDSLKTMTTATIDKNLTTTKSFVNSVLTKYNAYTTNLPTKDGFELSQLVVNRDRLLALKLVADIANPISSLTVQNADSTIIQDNKSKVSSFILPEKLTAEKANIEPLLTFLNEYLTNLENERKNITELISLISTVQTSPDLAKLTEARTKYDALSASGKKEVTNYNTLTSLESQYKAAMIVMQQINGLEPTAKDFASKTIAANTAYEKLTTTLKPAVSNYTTLQKLVPIAQVMQDINNIKETSTTLRTEYEAASSTYKKLTEGITAPIEGTTTEDIELAAKQQLLVTYGPKLAKFDTIIKTADTMIANITQLSTKKGQEFMDQLKILSEQYKKLDSVIKKNVTNAKTLTDLEKDYNSSLKVINLIEKLPANTDKSFASKVVSAEKAYQKLTAKQKEDVYNYPKLQNVLKAADIIARIEKLKVGTKTFDADLIQLRKEYDALTDAEKALVHNAAKLSEAEDNRKLAEDVVALINEATPSAENYIAKLTAARQAFDNLDKTQQKLVTNIKDLTSRERTVKPILKLDDDILKLDTSNAKTFLSKFKSAEKAYDKLSIPERALLVNAEKFTGELKTIYKVMEAINSIKSSSKTFVDDVKKARALYEDLPAETKAQISNLSVLEDHELNVLGGSKVDALISGLSSVAPTEYIAKVKEARTAYKALSSANKKAVTLEKELKAIEKYISPVEKAITEIDGLTNPKNSLSKQYAKVNGMLQKLDDKQRSYITNMDKYSNLSNVTYVYDLIEKLKPSDRYYQGNLEAAKIAYDKLSQDEKLKVTNYYKLQEAELDVDEAKNMINTIASLSSKSSTYFVDIEKALAAYKEIPSSLKKQITNYDKLKQAEKDMKAVQKVIKQIDAIDPLAKSYASKAKSALKAYQKLTEEQKQLVSNFDRLQTAINELGL